MAMITLKPTLRDIANSAGVSLGTASNVMNNKSHIAPETRERVLKAAAMMGYQHPIRQPLVSSTSLSVVGVILNRSDSITPHANSFYVHVIAGIEHECQRQHLSMMYASVQVDQVSKTFVLPSMVTDKQIDALIIIGPFAPTIVSELKSAIQIPSVIVNTYAIHTAMDNIVIDNEIGAYNAVNFLIHNGHRHIGFLGTANGGLDIQELQAGYLRALKAAGIDTSYVRELAENAPLRAGGYEATIKVLEETSQLSAIFACNDEVAAGAVNAARHLGYVIPRDLSIVGFGDSDLAKEIHPALTTMTADKIMMGKLAVRRLQEQAVEQDAASLTISLNTQFVLRKTVRDLNQ